MKKKDIIKRIEGKSDNCYRNIAKDCLINYKFNDFEKAIISEILCGMIENYAIEECFLKISKEYNVNCKKIVLSAIVPSIKMPTLKEKFLFFINKNEVIVQCLNIMKKQVVEKAFGS